MKNNKLRFLMITLLITVLFSGCSQAQKSSNQNKKEEIKVAISAEVNPPYLYTNKQNEFAGLDIDYLKLLEKKLPQYQFKYEVGEEESNLVGIGAGKFDMGINWFFKTPEREKQFLYQDVPYSYTLPLIVVHQNNSDIYSFNNLPVIKLTTMAPIGVLYSILSQYNNSHTQKIDIDTIQ